MFVVAAKERPPKCLGVPVFAGPSGISPATSLEDAPSWARSRVVLAAVGAGLQTVARHVQACVGMLSIGTRLAEPVACTRGVHYLGARSGVPTSPSGRGIRPRPVPHPRRARGGDNALLRQQRIVTARKTKRPHFRPWQQPSLRPQEGRLAQPEDEGSQHRRRGSPVISRAACQASTTALVSNAG
jgi:hypothetical protein